MLAWKFYCCWSYWILWRCVSNWWRGFASRRCELELFI